MRVRIKLFIIACILLYFVSGCSGSNIEPNGVSSSQEAATNVQDSATASTRQRSTENTVKPNGTLKVDFLDVGQADCIYIELPNNEKMLIDAGNNGDKDTILNYLDSLGVKRLDYVVGTHPHEDHIGSLGAVIDNYDIGSVYMPRASSNTKTFEDLLKSIKNKGLKVKAPESGSFLINLGNETDKKTVKNELVVQFLAPNKESYEDTNNYSIVVKITFRSISMLFMGDAEEISEKEIISAGYDVKSDLIKIGHHGSAYSSSSEFLEGVQPKFAVISVGKDNDYGHPARSTLDKLAAAGVKIFRTDETGTITAISDGETVKIDKAASPIKEQAPPKPTISQETTSSQARDVTVYITKTGKKYHLEGCRYLAKSKIPVKLSDAKDEGYTSCSVCNPPQ